MFNLSPKFKNSVKVQKLQSLSGLVENLLLMFFCCEGMVVCTLSLHSCSLKDIFKSCFRFQCNQNSTLQHSKIWAGLLMRSYSCVITFSTLYDACMITLSGMIIPNPLKLASTEFTIEGIYTLYLHNCMDARPDGLPKT